jgi:GT2 family glycosyltransferase
MANILRNFAVSKNDIQGDDTKEETILPTWEQVDIIFLTHNNSDMSLKCLDLLKRNTHHPFRLVWIDNGSELAHYDRVRQKVEEFNHIIHKFEDNRFYARAINQGIIMSNAKYVVTLSNDVLVSDSWLRKLLVMMEEDSKIGILSPLTNKIGSPICLADYAIKKWRLPINGNHHKQINALPRRFGNTTSSISMFCAVIRNVVMEKVGLLDERFFILGNDDDYCDRARLAGFKTGVCLNCFVLHEHGATKDVIFPIEGPTRLAIKRDHQALLREKRLLREKTGCLD